MVGFGILRVAADTGAVLAAVESEVDAAVVPAPGDQALVVDDN